MNRNWLEWLDWKREDHCRWAVEYLRKKNHLSVLRGSQSSCDDLRSITAGWPTRTVDDASSLNAECIELLYLEKQMASAYAKWKQRKSTRYKDYNFRLRPQIAAKLHPLAKKKRATLSEVVEGLIEEGAQAFKEYNSALREQRHEEKQRKEWATKLKDKTVEAYQEVFREMIDEIVQLKLRSHGGGSGLSVASHVKKEELREELHAAWQRKVDSRLAMATPRRRPQEP